jgi:hypothetical protein
MTLFFTAVYFAAIAIGALFVFFSSHRWWLVRALGALLLSGLVLFSVTSMIQALFLSHRAWFVRLGSAFFSFNLASAAIYGWRFGRPGRGSLGTTRNRSEPVNQSTPAGTVRRALQTDVP